MDDTKRTIQDITKGAHRTDNCSVGQSSTGLLGSRKLTVPQAARSMGLGQTKLREILHDGEIPALILDGKILLLERDLEDYLSGHYGALKVIENRPSPALAPLPEHIRNSSLLKRKEAI